MSVAVYRVQDREGRGPWRPGFSSRWVDHSRTREEYERLVPWMEEFGASPLAGVPEGWAVGCGCVDLETLRLWFTPLEYARLRQCGYRAVKMMAAKILSQSETQVLFIRKLPLAKAARSVSLYSGEAMARRKEKL